LSLRGGSRGGHGRKRLGGYQCGDPYQRANLDHGHGSRKRFFSELPENNPWLESVTYTDDCIISSDTDGGANWWLFFKYRQDGKNKLGFDFGSDRTLSSLVVPVDTPAFISISCDPSGTLFTGGNTARFAVWDGSSWTYSEHAKTSDLRLDGLEIGSFADGIREFQGDLDEVRIYDAALTEAELDYLALSSDIGGALGGQVSVLGFSSTNIDVTIRFSEEVHLFDASDLLLTGTLSNAVPVMTGSGNAYTSSIPIYGDGVLTVDLIPGSGVQTPAGNPLVYHTPDTQLIDFSGPYVVSIQSDVFSGEDSGALTEIVFSEPVLNFSNSDIVTTVVTNLNWVNSDTFFTQSPTSYTGNVFGPVADGFVTGSYTISVDLNSDVTDLHGNALTTPNPTSTVEVVATDYQLWIINAGVTNGFYYGDDPDHDGRINGHEFMRDGDPSTPFDAIKQAIHVESISGTNYAVLTMAAPDDAVYEESGGGLYVEYCGGSSLCMFETLNVITNLINITYGEFDVIEDPSISTPSGMPTLSTNFSYRHFRFTTPMDELPQGFFRVETIDLD